MGTATLLLQVAQNLEEPVYLMDSPGEYQVSWNEAESGRAYKLKPVNSHHSLYRALPFPRDSWNDAVSVLSEITRNSPMKLLAMLL